MKLIRITFIFCLFILASNSFRAQEYDGYFGKRFFIDLNYSCHVPVVVNLTGSKHVQYFLKGNDSLVSGFNWFNSGGRLSAGYILGEYFSLAVEYGIEKSRVGLPQDAAFYPGGQTLTIRHEALNITTHGLLLKGEFSGNNMRPIGISHEIGLGVSMSTVKNRNYGYSVGASDSVLFYDDNTVDSNPVDFNEIAPVLNYVAMYGVKFRKPLTKSLMFTGGFKYYLNLDSFMSRQLINDINNSYTLQVEDAISRQRLFSILQANIGLTLLF